MVALERRLFQSANVYRYVRSGRVETLAFANFDTDQELVTAIAAVVETPQCGILTTSSAGVC